MRRIITVSMLALITAAAGATALYVTQQDTVIAGKPCFISGNAGYLLSAAGNGSHIVRVDNAAEKPDLRLQRVDDPAAADFVLIDDSDATTACKGVSIVEHIAIDAAAAKPDLIVAISRDPADTKIYLHSLTYTEQDAAALAAVIWQRGSRPRGMRTVSR